MFKKIAAQWREARAPVIKPDVLDIISRYNRWGQYERYECLSAFDYTKDHLENERGPIQEWPESMAKEIHQALMSGAKKGFNIAPYGANGHALLSFYIELHHVPGQMSDEVRLLILNWHATGLKNDMPKVD